MIGENWAVAEEWFRSPLWDETARTEFEQRLGRARAYNRPPHLRIKAIALRRRSPTQRHGRTSVPLRDTLMPPSEHESAALLALIRPEGLSDQLGIHVFVHLLDGAVFEMKNPAIVVVVASTVGKLIAS